MASITVESGGEREAYGLESPAVVLGRGLEADVRLKDIKSSRRHCQIERQGAAYLLTDLGSGNGTYLNGVQVSGAQTLTPGDRIQIGDTVITFQGDPAPRAAAPAPAATPNRSATQRMSNPRPTTGRHAPSSRPQTAPYQKPTAHVPRPTASVKTGARPQTSRLQKSPTGQTQRAPTTRSTVNARRTEQFAAAARKPKKNPVLIGGIVVGVIVLAFIAILMIPDSEAKRADLNAAIEKVLREASALRGGGKLDEAIARYREALRIAEGDAVLKKKYRDYEGVIKEIQADQKVVAGAGAEWESFKTEYDRDSSARTVSSEDLLLRALKLKRSPQAAGAAWLGELETCIQKLQRVVDTDRAIRERNKFQGFRNELVAKFGIDKPETAQYGPAIVSLKQWLQTAEGEERGRGERELQGLEGRAEEAMKKIATRFNVIVSNEGKTKAREFLELSFQRLRGSPQEQAVRDLMKKLE